MADATVCVPWRPQPERIAAHDRCIRYWKGAGFDVVEANSDPRRPFLCAQARNKAIRAAGTDVVVVADADTLPRSIEQVSEAIKVVQADPAVVVWPFTIYRFVPADWVFRDEPLTEAPIVLEAQNSPGGIIVAHRDTLRRIGGFDENFSAGTWGFDDEAFRLCAQTLTETARIAGVVYSFDHSVSSVQHDGAVADRRDFSDSNPNKHRCALYEFAFGKPDVMRALVGVTACA